MVPRISFVGGEVGEHLAADARAGDEHVEAALVAVGVQLAEVVGEVAFGRFAVADADADADADEDDSRSSPCTL